RAYMNEEEWQAVLEALGTNEIDLRDTYDAVFHLVTAAKGAEDAYTLSNNAARTESLEQARELDDKLLASWTGHPHLRIIDNSSDFRQKLERLMAEITSFLGEPDPCEIERKYLIAYPDLDWLASLPNATKVEMVQTYLTSPEDVQVRVRRRGIDGHYIYFWSEKRNISDTRRVEIEERLSKEEYERFLLEADPETRPIRKTRYCMADGNLYFELDLYPEWKKQAILEIELRDENQEVHFPEGIRVIREVTDDKRYKNYSLAHHMLEEEVT
ncbi:MAG: AAA family ATPase, partial [Lachnospiraceae bacterium]|nr:AAA family ATPase [Lachnospiraceae bacterium]